MVEEADAVVAEAAEDNAITVKVIGELLIPDKAAITLAVPPPMPVTTPYGEMVTTVLSELVQVTQLVIFSVEPSEYVPVAVK